MNEVEVFVRAGELYHQGYIGISNKFNTVGRIDTSDWLNVLAEHLGCAVADFYRKDGSGVSDQWREHYIRCYTKDKLTVDPEVYKVLKRQQNF